MTTGFDRPVTATSHHRLTEPIDRDALNEVLSGAEQSARANPAETGLLVRRCAEVATTHGWPDLAARATYLDAQLCALDGRPEDAAALLEAARQSFADLGMVAEAQRTVLGQAHVDMLRGRADRAAQGLTSLIEACRASDRPDATSLEVRARQNLGAVLIHQGDLEHAIEHLDAARVIAAASGETDLVLELTNNEAMALLRLGRAAGAIELAVRALDAAGDADRFVHAQVRDTLGRAQLVAGEFAAALDNLGSALATFEHLGLQGEISRTRIALGDALLTCNLTAEAHVAYTQALDESDTDSEVVGWAALGAAQTSLERCEPSRALALAETARSTFSCAGSAVGLSLAHLTIARIEHDRDNTAGALAHGDLALAEATKAGLPVEMALADLFLHRIDGDQQRLDRAGLIVDAIDLPSLAAEWHTRSGQDHRARQDPARAAASFRAAIAAVERQRGTLAGERHRRMFMAGRTAAYDALQELLAEQATDTAVSEAFVLGELVRARELQEAMAGHVRPSEVTGPAAALDQVASASLRLGSEGLLDDGPVRLAERPRDRVHAPSADSTRELRNLQLALGPTVTYVAYSRVGPGLQAFVVNGDSLRRVNLLDSIEDLHRPIRELDAQMARMQSTAFAERWAGDLVRSVHTTLELLHALLVAPLGLTADPGGAGALVISPSAELNGIPFAALRDGERSLIDDYAITLTPSARAWLSCRERPPATGPSKVFALATSRLPHIRLEGVEVAKSLTGSRDLALTERASRQHALTMRRPTVAHFACHGQFRPRQPMMSTLRLADGNLTAHEFAATDLEGSLVVLSACESGRGAAIAGPEVLGFERAAFLAGARVAVTSRWLVDDACARSIMSHFHREVAAGVAPAHALRAAQLHIRSSHPHPYHWAAFSCAGAGFEPHVAPASLRALVS